MRKLLRSARRREVARCDKYVRSARLEMLSGRSVFWFYVGSYECVVLVFLFWYFVAVKERRKPTSKRRYVWITTDAQADNTISFMNETNTEPAQRSINGMRESRATHTYVNTHYNEHT